MLKEDGKQQIQQGKKKANNDNNNYVRGVTTEALRMV